MSNIPRNHHDDIDQVEYDVEYEEDRSYSHQLSVMRREIGLTESMLSVEFIGDIGNYD